MALAIILNIIAAASMLLLLTATMRLPYRLRGASASARTDAASRALSSARHGERTRASATVGTLLIDPRANRQRASFRVAAADE